MNIKESEQKVEIQREALSILASLYGEVFGAPPWNEVWRCQQCDRFYGPGFVAGQLSPCCQKTLVTAYPIEETSRYIEEELKKPLARLVLGFSQNDQLVSFAWGYQVEDACYLARKKWPQSTATQTEVVKAITQFQRPELPSYYISEVGVNFDFRGNGFGTETTRRLLEYANENRLPVVLRTTLASSMTKISLNLGMTQIMGPVPTFQENSVIKSGKIINFLDGVNPERVLFIKLPNLC